MIRKLVFLHALAVATAISLAGCGGGGANVGAVTVPTAAPPSISGTVYAGRTPIAGSTVTLYLVGAKGGSATSLGSTTTSSSGTFSIPLTLQYGNSPLYVVASGGFAGTVANNHAIRLMSVAGSASNPISPLTINELSTVASGYAFAQFLNGTSVAGAPLSMEIAAGTAQNLIAPKTGTAASVIASAPNGAATEALPLFESLAAILTSCTQNAAGCPALFAAAAALPGGVTPTDTLQATVNIALAPAQNVSTLYSLMPAVTPYSPALSSAPNAWTIALLFTNGGFTAPGRMAFDAVGNIWVTNNFNQGTTNPGQQATVLNSVGQPIFGSPILGGGLSGAAFGVAIDQSGRAWFASFGGSTMTIFTPNGAVFPGSPFDTGANSKPQGIALDQAGNMWSPNYGNSTLTEYPGANIAAPQTFTGNGLNTPFAIAVDGSGTVWVSNAYGFTPTGSVSAFSSSGAPMPFSPITGAFSNPLGIAVDSTGNVFVANFQGKSLTMLSNSGKVLPNSPVTGPSFLGTWSEAVDGNDNVWVANFFGDNVTEVCGAKGIGCPAGAHFGTVISPSAGFTSKALQNLTAVQIDSAGNVWVCNNIVTGGTLASYTGGNGLVEFIGMASPVKTPLVGPPSKP